MQLVFWLGVVPLVGLCVGAWVLAKATRPDLPLDALPRWRQSLRVFLIPKHDATPEEVARMERAEAEQAAEARHREVVRAIYNANATGRGP